MTLMLQFSHSSMRFLSVVQPSQDTDVDFHSDVLLSHLKL